MSSLTRPASALFLIVLAYVGFVSLGLPDAVIGVAWPTVRDTFALPQGAVGLVFVASGIGYFVTSFFSGRLTHALGIGSLLAASTALVAAAMFGFAFSPLWVAFVGGAVGFGGMFAVYSYVSPLLTDVTGLAITTVPLVLALFGVGMTIGTLLGGRLADRSVLRTVYLGFASTIAVLVVIALTGGNALLAVASIVALGISSQILGLALQTRLMDLSPTAPSLGAALCHSALNLGNATGAWLGGLVIAAGYGYLAPAWVGAVLTAVGLLVVATVGRGAPHAFPGAPDAQSQADTLYDDDTDAGLAVVR